MFLLLLGFLMTSALGGLHLVHATPATAVPAQRVLRFPANVELHDALTGEREGSSTRQWRPDLKQGETRLLRWRIL